MELVRRARHSWFAAFWPAAAVAVAAALLIAALVVGQRPVGGPEQTHPPAASSVASPSASSEPSAAPQVGELLAPGDSVEIEAVDATGTWGSIVIVRGPDHGGFPNAPVEDAFVIELEVAYEPERWPEGEFGVEDWAVARAADRRPAGGIFDPPTPEDPAIPIEGLSMGSFPGAIDIFSTPTDGLLFFEVPHSASNEELVLIYRPDGFDEALMAIPLRRPGEPPDPVVAATPAPTPRPQSYIDAGGAFTIIDSAAADALFATPDSCTNRVGGFTITFPDDWYTNTAVGGVPACSWFSPTFYEVADPDTVPAEIAITINSFRAAIGFVHQPLYTVNDQIQVDGWSAYRAEELGGFGADGLIPRSVHTYQYTVYADEDEAGLKVIGTTSNEMGGDYDLNKAVLDRIMASMRFDR